MTERIFLEDPVRAQCAAEVVAVRGSAVVLTRTVLYGGSRAYDHVQPPDRGHLVADAGKVKVSRAVERDGTLLHLLEGAPPAAGSKVQVHLDLPRRLAASRAHTLAHVLVHVARGAGVVFLAPPRVVGGGGVRARIRGRTERLLARLRAEVAADRRVTAAWVPPERAPDPAPWRPPLGDGAVRQVAVDGLGALPCDGTHARRTSELGEVRGRLRTRVEGGADLELELG